MSFTWSACLDDSPQNDMQGGKRTKISHPMPGTLNISNWDIDGGLAADFDGSLSGLGAELGTSTYNMSEALLALPVFKQENLDNGFQYILGAATSPAVKVNEETLTYLNQGQSYEIKLKRLGDLSEFQGKFLRSVIKVCFHDRRLQYMEKEQLDSWKQTRRGERILDIDIPLSYGLMDLHVDSSKMNSIDFIWDPTKETGVYVKVNCISTEFTPKKHGGEKGVPFRLQVETSTHEEESPKILHCASCQIKVFKPKGADRKHKTDREKMEKRTEAEKEKFQPSYECTVLTEVPVDQFVKSETIHSMGSFGSLAQAYKDQCAAATNLKSNQEDFKKSPPISTPPSSSTQTAGNRGSGSQSSSPSSIISVPQLTPMSPIAVPEVLSPEANAAEVAQWLQYNRFSYYSRVFQNFSGADLLRLTRDDLIQICGLADGIRLNNALQARNVRPRLTLYICQEPATVYHALYLERLTCNELISKISDLFSLQKYQILDVYIQGPSSIHILITDEVVQNLQDLSRFWLEAIKDTKNPEYFKLLLKAIE